MLHDDVVCEDTVATGLTVTLTIKAAPVQLPSGEVGVTLYTAVAAAAVVLLRLSYNILCPDSGPALPEMLLPVGVPHA